MKLNVIVVCNYIHIGVSVYTAFQRLGANERRDILTALLMRFVTQGASGMMK